MKIHIFGHMSEKVGTSVENEFYLPSIVENAILIFVYRVRLAQFPFKFPVNAQKTAL